MKRVALWVIGASILLLLLIVGLGGPSLFDRSGVRFKAAFVDQIKRSNRIVVSEHSSPFESGPPGSELLVYQTRELSAEEKQRLLSTVEAMNSAPKTMFYGCTFNPHHTIEFYASDGSLSTMKICFECHDLRWDNTFIAPPQAFFSDLAGFMQSIGFAAERDWRTLAEEAKKSKVGTVSGDVPKVGER